MDADEAGFIRIGVNLRDLRASPHSNGPKSDPVMG
jgi:hypothetical protein